MQKSISLKRNVVANALRTMLSFIFPLITFPYVSRILGPEGLGRVNFGSSVVAYFVVIASIGIPFYGTREVARYREDKEKLRSLVLELLSINLISILVAYALLFIAVALIPQFREDAALIAILSLAIGFTAIGMEWLFQGLEQYVYITIRSFVFQLLALVLLFVLVHGPRDVLAYAGLTTLAAVGSNVVNFISAFKYFGGRRRVPLRLGRHLRPIFTMFGMNVAISVYLNLNAVMLGFFSGNSAVGFYSVPLKIVNIVQSVVGSFAAVMMPRSSFYIQNKQSKEFERLVSFAFRFLITLGVPCVIGLIGLSDSIILLFAGESFAPSAGVLCVTSANILIVGLSNLFGIQILIPNGKEKITFYSVVLGAVVDLCLNFLLMPRWAEMGAAISIAVTELSITLFQAFFCRGYIKTLVGDSHKLLPCLVGNVFIIAVLFCFRFFPIPMVLRTVVSVLVSAGGYALILWIMKDELFEKVVGKCRPGRAG